jgi:hypothetical protein
LAGHDTAVLIARLQRPPAPKADSSFGADVTKAEGKFSFSDFLNFVLSEKYDVGVAIRALQSREALPEPCRAERGRSERKEASFSRARIPDPDRVGNGNNMGISVQFKSSASGSTSRRSSTAIAAVEGQTPR